MTISAGAIQYTVEVETGDVLVGTNSVNKQLDSMSSKMNEADKSSSKLSGSMGAAAKATNTESAALQRLLGQINPVLGATQRLDSQTEALGKAFDKGQISAAQYASNLALLDKQYAKLEGDGKKAKSTTDKLSVSLTPLAAAISGVISIQALANLQKLSEQFTLLESRIKRLSTTSAEAQSNYAALIKISSAGGSDLTTTIKLWESLTASLKELGVTNNQILSLTDTLQKIGKIGGSSTEEISAALRQFSQSVSGGTLRAEEFNSIIEQMPELGRKIAAGLGIPFNELRQQMLDGKLTIDRVLGAIYSQTGKVNAEFNKVPRSTDAAKNAIVNSMGVAISKIDQATGASQALARALDAVANGIRLSSGQLTDQQQLNKLVLDRATAEQQYATQIKFGLATTAENTKKRIESINSEIQAIQDRKVAEQKAENDKIKITAPKNAKKTESQKELDDLEKHVALSRLDGVERAKLQAVQKLGDKATDEEKAKAAQLAAEIYKLETARKADAATNRKAKSEAESLAKKAAAAEQTGIKENMKAFTKIGEELSNVHKGAREVAQDQAQLTLNKYATPEQVQAIRDIAGALYDSKTAQETLARVDPKSAATQGHDKELKDLKSLNEQKFLSDTDYLALKEQSEKDYHARMAQLEVDRFAAQSAGNAAMVAGFEALATSGTQAFSGLLSGTMSLQDAMGGIANTVLNAVIGSFVQAGVEWVKQQAMMQVAAASTTATQVAGTAAVTGAQVAATGTIAATTTTAAAATGGAVATSMAPAAGLSSIASFGGAAVIGGAALLATMLLAKSFSGKGRALGGPVQSDGMYRVNETGAPEIFNAANGRQYMMPNTRGEVVSNHNATSGGGGSAAPIVNVNNYSGQAATSTAKFSESDRAWVVDVIVGDGMGDGKTSRMINQITGTRRQGV